MRDAEAGLARRMSTVLQIWMRGKGSGLRRHYYERWYTDNFLDMSHEIIKSYKPDLSLQVSVFAKMSSGVAKNISLIRSSEIRAKYIAPPIFSSKTLLNTEDVSETRKAGF